MLTFLRERETALQEERDGLQSELDTITTAMESESRSKPTDEEFTRFQDISGKIDGKDAELAEVRENIKTAEEREARAAKEAEVRKETDPQGTGEQRAATRVGAGPSVYRKDGQDSYFRDLVSVNLNRPNARSAMERLQRNQQQVESETRALSTTDGAGGDFAPPLWMVNDYVALARTARPTADRVRNETLPSGTDQINVPKILTGTAVAEQATQNTGVQNTDATTGAVAANVTTLAGQQVVAVQLIEQSPINMDTILLQDLAFDYAAKVDLFVLNNSGTNKNGLLQQSGTNAVTYTQATPAVGGAGGFYANIANGVQLVTTNRFAPPDTIVMHPRRWAWLLAASDTANRPLVAYGPRGDLNSPAVANGVAAVNGVVGNIQGLDVIVDPQIPTNLGAGTNQDPVIIMRASDHILWEGAPNAEAFRETKADQLSVLLRFYRYAAFTANRYAKSTTVVNGTGLVTPTF